MHFTVVVGRLFSLFRGGKSPRYFCNTSDRTCFGNFVIQTEEKKKFFLIIFVSAELFSSESKENRRKKAVTAVKGSEFLN